MAVPSLVTRSGNSTSSIPSSLPIGSCGHHLSGFKKPHTKPSSTSELAGCFRPFRTFPNRSAGMLSAALICLFSLLTLMNFANRVSVHHTSPPDKEMVLETIDSGKIRSSEPDADTTGRTGDPSSPPPPPPPPPLRFQESASVIISAPHVESLEQRNHVRRSFMSSDQPLPLGHPCHGFTLPPPPADKKRTGPRPCPVCYLPVKNAIKKMPAMNTTRSSIIKRLSYIIEPVGSRPDVGLQGSHFGGHPTLEERHKSFEMHENMNIHCGFARGVKPGIETGFDIDESDLLDMEKCRGIVVASAIFGNYDILQQPKNISRRSMESVCFFMFVDEETHNSLYMGGVDQSLGDGVWRLVVVHNMPYSDARRNGKIPKLLLHRLFPNARYSLWIDGKLELVVDPIQILERFLWRRNRTFAISQHYKRFDVYEEAEANKAAGKYDNFSIDAQINFYKTEGLQHFDPLKSPFTSDVPEGCVIMREHNPITNLFTCLWFNEVDRFTSRDQLSFAIVRNKLSEKVEWGFSMFLDCERRNFVVQAYHKDLLEKKKAQQETNPISMNLMPQVSAKSQDTTLLYSRQTRKRGPRKQKRRQPI